MSQSSDTGYVFVSYSRGDESIARLLRERLLARGIAPWMDVFDIAVGARWPDEIDRALQGADAVLGVLTNSALNSTNVKNEWDWAIANGRRLLLARFESCSLPFHYVSLNYIDFTDGFDMAFEQLASTLEQLGTLSVDLESTADTRVATAGESSPIQLPQALVRANLPTSGESLIGREQDVESLLALLATNRLTTILGPGGIGKTRLSQAVAESASNNVSGGTYFIPLTSLDRPEQVGSSIARELGIPENPDESHVTSIAAHIGDSEMLLVLDNFEHLLPAAELVSQLLRACRGLKIMVTSRSPLNLTDEQEYPLRPLGEHYAAQLFVKRAREINPAFDPDADEWAIIVEICRKLDGVPLAIELAASRTRLLPVTQLNTRLARPLSVLTGGPRDLARHQQTLRDTIAWSYDLLGHDEQRLFSILAVFAGEWSLDAAEAIAGDELDVLEGMTILAESSLIEGVDDDKLEPRFRMLETIREFANERLDERDDADSLRTRHGYLYLDLVSTALTHLYGAEQVDWLDRLEREHANLRVALDWLADHDIDAGLRLVATLWRLWWTRGYLDTGRYYYDLLLERAESADPDPASQALARGGAGIVAEWQREHARATELQQQALEIWDTMDQPDDEAFWPFVSLGNMALMEGRLADAERIYGEGLAFAVQHQLVNGILVLQDNVGYIALKQGRYEVAEQSIRATMKSAEEHGHIWNLELAYAQLGTLKLQQRELAEARQYLERALNLAEELGNIRDVAAAACHLGHVELDEGNLREAEALYTRCIEMSNSIDDSTWIGEAHLGLSMLSDIRGAQLPRRQHLEEALRASIQLGEPDITVRVIEAFARWHLDADHLELAASAREFASQDRVQHGVPVSPRWQRLLDDLDREMRDSVSDADRAEAAERADSMTLEQIADMLSG